MGLAAFEDDGALASAAGIPMRQNVRGLVAPMAGIASVTSHPLARRRGFVRELMRRILGDMRKTGHVVSALYPFRPSLRTVRLALPVAPDEQPELSGTDLAITVTTEVAYPSKTAPMVRSAGPAGPRRGGRR